MSKRFIWIVGPILIGALALGACAATPASAEEGEHRQDAALEGEDEHQMDGEHMQQMDMEHMDMEHMDDEHTDGSRMHMHADPPPEYADLENPFAGSHEAAEAGEELFMANCTPCHGETGAGDGPAAEMLDPQPANLADADMMAMMTDAYMFWRISEGGAFEPFNSAMPSWKAAFDEEQRWQLIAFVRELPEHGH